MYLNLLITDSSGNKKRGAFYTENDLSKSYFIEILNATNGRKDKLNTDEFHT